MRRPRLSTLLPLLIACGSGNGDSAEDVAYTDVEALWYGECALACHGGGLGGDELLNLEEGSSHTALVGVPSEQLPSMNRVEPGEPEQSYLWHKLNGTHLNAGGTGEPMPKAWSFSEGSGTIDHYPLDTADLELVETWILQGASP
jgi:hypothetical protein